MSNCKWLDYNKTQTNHPPDFFCQKRLATNVATFVVFGDSDFKARITPQLLSSTSSGCCRETLRCPKALTGCHSLNSFV